MNGKQARSLRKTASELTTQRTYREVNVKSSNYPTGRLNTDGTMQYDLIRTSTVQNIGQRAVYLGLKQNYSKWSRSES